MNTLRRKVARLAALVLASTGLVLGLGVNTPASAAELLLDGGFEATVGGNSPNWTEADSAFGSPLCDASCGGVGPHAGTWWSWFGGTPSASTGSLSQSVTIPAGGATLSFYLWISSAPAPADATLNVKMDATVVKTYSDVIDAGGWTLRTLDVSAFAGGTHTLSFNYSNPTAKAGSPNFHLDDISLTDSAPVTTATPTVTAATPPGPSTSPTTQVTGTAAGGSTVTLYPNSSCTGLPLGSGTAAAFATPGITATVPANSTTTIYAQAGATGQADSACSSTSVSYTNDSAAPNTTITTGPTGGIAKSLTVPFAFTSSESPSTFTCSLDAAPFTACTSPTTLTVAAGKHTFQVTAKDALNNADATPASVTFTAYNCAALTTAVTDAQTKADAASKGVKKAKKALKKAKKSGDASKVKKAKKKLKKAKSAQKTADAALATAQAPAAPCAGSAARTVATR